MSALMISRITVKDPQKFQDYITRTKQVAASFGAELLFQGQVDKTLNGDEDHRLVVIARFPDIEHINDWFASADYQPLQGLRDEAADMHMTSYADAG